MNEENEILFNKIYEQTKGFGRTQFVREMMNLQRKNAELQECYNNMFECHCNRVEVEKIQNNWNELKKSIEDDIKEYEESKIHIKEPPLTIQTKIEILIRMQELEGNNE